LIQKVCARMRALSGDSMGVQIPSGKDAHINTDFIVL